MKRKKIKILTLFMVFIFMTNVFAACSNNNNEQIAVNETKQTENNSIRDKSTGIDTSKRVELQFYMLGNAPKDLPIIEAEINKMALEDLNATVKFNYITWTNWEQKYKLLLTSGQPMDLIFTAGWTQYQAYAKQGAFLALDDLLPAAAPKLYDFVPQEMWDAVRIDGKIQTVPATWKEYVTEGIVYREDLRDKHNLPVPNSIEAFEVYMEGIKQNEPDIIPMGTTLSNHMGPYMDIKYEPAGTTLHGVPYGLILPYKNPSNVIKYYGSEDHLADLKRMNTWMNKGYWSRNVMNMNDEQTALLQNGKTASILGENPNRYNDSVLKIASTQPEWELAYFPFPEAKGYATPVHPIHNGFAIPKISSNPERALAFYEKMVTDKRYNWLTSYGIEETHFEVVDGFYQMVGTVDTNGFGREAMNGWAWRNPEFMLFPQSFQAVQNIFDEFDKIASPDIFTGFAEDWSPYQAERAALEQVERQYLFPLNVGLIDDVEAGLALFMEKANQAGLEKIQAEYTRQWLQYLEEAGIN